MGRMLISGRAWGLRLTSGYEIFCCFYAFSVPVNDAIQPYQRSPSMNSFDPILEFSKWPEIFKDATRVAALVDRLPYHSRILNMNGESYRFQNARKRKS